MTRIKSREFIISLYTARRVSRSKRVARLMNFDQQRASLELRYTLAALSGAFQSFFDSCTRLRVTD